MTKPSITDRLARGDRLLIDGATGSELQRRGVDVLKGASAEAGLGPWTATANLEAPEVAQQVHRDYLRVGADIVTSANFWTNRPRLESIGLGERWQEYARAGGENAVKARDAGNPSAYAAGGLAPPALKPDSPDVEVMGAAAFHAEFAEQAKILAETGVDLLLAEYVGHVADCVAIVDACAESGLPVFLAVRHVRRDGRLPFGESFADLVSALEGHPVDALLIMCSYPEDVSAGLPLLRDAYDGPIGAYPRIGYNPLGPVGGRNPSIQHKSGTAQRDIIQTGGYTPSSLAAFVDQWLDMGAQMVGGCCAAGPEHVMAMNGVLRGHSAYAAKPTPGSSP